MNIARIDLNLLVAFDALLAEGNVTRAAERVGLSQPAMSAALGRLRRALDDPILVRTARGMVPTPRAKNLIGPVCIALSGIERGLEGAQFTAERSTRSFVLACTDYPQTVLLPGLMRRLAQDAPAVKVSVVASPAGPFRPLLETGQVDLAIGWAAEAAPHLRDEILFEDRIQCLVREDHPRVRTRLTRRHLRTEAFVLLTPPGSYPWAVDAVLRRNGIERNCPLTVSGYLVEPLVVARTDLLAFVPNGLARTFAPFLGLRVLDLPIAVPRASFRQIWHARDDNDPGHQWFRGVVSEVARSFSGRTKKPSRAWGQEGAGGAPAGALREAVTKILGR